jgi:DNA repair protein RecO (recombination protein O)
VQLRSEAILLRAVDFGESDRIVHLLTPHRGRLTAIAKGARRSVKRFPGSLDIGNHLRVLVECRRKTSMPRLDQAVLVDAFLGLRTVPTRFALACYVLEIVDRMAPEGGAERDMARLFAFTRAALGWIAEQQPDARLRLWLELRVLEVLGLRPELRRCVSCGREPTEGDRVAFKIADGGMLCGACNLRVEGAMPVHLGTLRALDRALSLPAAELGRLSLAPDTLDEAQRLVERFQRFHVGIELRSQVVLDRLLRTPQRGRTRAAGEPPVESKDGALESAGLPA